jgi:hypothetical protein
MEANNQWFSPDGVVVITVISVSRDQVNPFMNKIVQNRAYSRKQKSMPKEASTFSDDERVLCYHGPMLYEAKVRFIPI